MARRLFALAALICLCALAQPAARAEEPGQDFREANGLVAYEPPAWFLDSPFVARENDPRFVFASVREFVRHLKRPTAWLIEEAEIKRLERVSQAGKPMEYSLYLEQKTGGQAVYWMFVALPYESVQDWFQDRWTYHRSKAEGFYGKTQAGLLKASAEGLAPKADLRFLVVNGQVSLTVPEDILTGELRFPAVYDLAEDRRLTPAAAAR